MSKSLTMKLPDEDLESLNFIAKHFDRSKNYLAVQAIKLFIRKKLAEIEDEKDYREALKAWKDDTMENLTTEDITISINEKCPR